MSGSADQQGVEEWANDSEWRDGDEEDAMSGMWVRRVCVTKGPLCVVEDLINPQVVEAVATDATPGRRGSGGGRGSCGYGWTKA